MTEREQERRLERLERGLQSLRRVVLEILEYLNRHRPGPAAGHLTATFHRRHHRMNAVLVATVPTTRKDNTPLAATDIGSITFQKTALQPDGSAGAEQTLEVNTAGAGGLTPDQITFTDTTATPGDSYTFFVTDTAGNVGDVSNAQVAPTPVPVLAAPAAGTLDATFS